MRVVLEARTFSLDLSLAPSFISSLYARASNGTWIKIGGFLRNQLKLKQIAPELIEAEVTATLPRELLEDEVSLETGLWHEPFEDALRKLSRKLRAVAVSLAEAYPGVRLPVAKHDFTEILIAVALSKRTGYQRFVLPWCYKIWEGYGHDVRLLASLSPDELRVLGTSYQLFNMVRTLKSYLEAPHAIHRLPARLRQVVIRADEPESLFQSVDPDVARPLLLNLCWGVGPKTADSVILSTFKAPHMIPCDTHLATIARRLGIASRFAMPRKPLCCNFSCRPNPHLELCPSASRCIRGILTRELGELGGWFQTILYLHGTKYCLTAKPKCSSCPIRSLCEAMGND